VQWFRSVAGNGWELFDGMELQANGMYLDTDNPCTTKFKPPAPLIAPMIQPDGWTQIAGEGLLPWCLGTKYMVRYRVGESIGDWGPASATISSSTFTFPKLVDTENNNYVKEWGRVLGGRVYVPEVLQFTVMGDNFLYYPKNFVFDGVDSHGTLSTNSFVSQWNAQGDPQFGFGQFSVLPDGRLQLDLTGHSSRNNLLWGQPIIEIFLRLGFDYHIFNIVDGPFVATTVPTLEVVHVGGSEFIDINNPCTTDKPPSPLIAPMIQPDGWTQIAGEGLVPWCLGTKYMVRYRVGESIGDWGPASATISSSTFTFPKLVDTENSNYVKEWGRVLVGRVYVPAVLQFTVSGQSNVQYPKNFVFDGVDSNGTLSTSSFVSQWNAQDFGQFSVLPDGRLQLDLTGYRSSRNILLGDPIRQFFLRLGFDYHIFNIVDGPFVATTVPTLEVVYVGGSEFIDINNPCKIPNGPLNAPSSGGWLTTF